MGAWGSSQSGMWRAAFWVCGTFEVHDGRITVWRDRFDFADLTWAFLRGDAQHAAVRAFCDSVELVSAP